MISCRFVCYQQIKISFNFFLPLCVFIGLSLVDQGESGSFNLFILVVCLLLILRVYTMNNWEETYIDVLCDDDVIVIMEYMSAANLTYCLCLWLCLVYIFCMFGMACFLLFCLALVFLVVVCWDAFQNDSWTSSVCRIVSFGLEDFQERFGGLQPSQFVDILALMGDRIDNIPGAVSTSNLNDMFCLLPVATIEFTWTNAKY